MGKVKLQLLTTTDDTKDNVVTFTSGDEAAPTQWKDVNVLSSNEKHLSLLNKISTMFNNIRYLYKILGTTDISALGTVTQAISTIKGNIGDMKGISSSTAITTQGEYALDAREKNASVDGTLANQISTLNSNFNNFNNYVVKSFAITMRAGELQDNITVEDYVVMVCPMYTYDWYKNMMIPYMHTTDPHHIIGVKSITGQISSEDITYHIFALCKIN